jgi:hypothetical protein
MSEAEKTLEVEDVLSSIRRLVAERPKPVEVPVQAAPPEEQAEINAPDLPHTEVNNFVDTINASIAKMTEEYNVKTPEVVAQEPEIHTQENMLSADVDAFVANETAQALEELQIVEKKAEPFVLRADMVAIAPELETEEVMPDFSQSISDYSEPETAFQDIPEEVDELPNSKDDEAEEAVVFEQTPPDQDALFVDEETLREIVSELVRSELQGDLGDRITRNVRKLVRREIHHALASRDFT